MLARNSEISSRKILELEKNFLEKFWRFKKNSIARKQSKVYFWSARKILEQKKKLGKNSKKILQLKENLEKISEPREKFRKFLEKFWSSIKNFRKIYFQKIFFKKNVR